jgi:hypothetical protein
MVLLFAISSVLGKSIAEEGVVTGISVAVVGVPVVIDDLGP